MTETVLYQQEGGLVILTINLPALRNPISGLDVVDPLVAALDRMGADPSVHVAILTGAGTAFSSGGNLRAMAAALDRRGSHPADTPAYYLQGIQRIPLAFERLDVPVIAAVNGPAIGAGCDLACMCDIRIAAESARFAESFVKVGIVPGDGGAWLLPRIVGFSKASEMALTGDSLTAAEALACGLVSQVVPDAELMTAARAMAARISVNPSKTVRLTKRLLREGRHSRLDSLLEFSAVMQALAHTTSDHREAVTAFIEKRKPKFTHE